MLLLRYLLLFAGAGLFAGAAAMLIWDLYQMAKWRKPPGPGQPEGEEWHAPPAWIRWHQARRTALMGLIPLLAGLSIALVPSGSAGVRVNQFAGTRPRTLYPGVHFVLPLIENMETYSVRDNVFITTVAEDPKKKLSGETLRVQTRDGLTVGMAVAVRFRLNAEHLAYIHSNVPQPVEEQVIVT